MYKNFSLVVIFALFTLTFSSCKTQKELKSSQAQVTKLNSKVLTLTKEQAALTSELETCKSKSKATQKELNAIESALKKQYDDLIATREIIEIGMADFVSQGVSVVYDNGLIHVIFQEGLLYKSGSAELGENGIKALKSLGEALNNYPMLKVFVVGNTDSDKFEKGINMDNWTLSTDRANGVVRILRDNYKVDPARLVSCGRGKYDPVALNTTKEGKAANRRTDIILQPNIDLIWDMVENIKK